MFGFRPLYVVLVVVCVLWPLALFFLFDPRLERCVDSWSPLTETCGKGCIRGEEARASLGALKAWAIKWLPELETDDDDDGWTPQCFAKASPAGLIFFWGFVFCEAISSACIATATRIMWRSVRRGTRVLQASRVLFSHACPVGWQPV